MQDVDPGSDIPGKRYGNTSKVRMEIRYGKDLSKFSLTNVYIDYIKTPKLVILTEEQVEEVEDTSQTIEFPEDIILEIINIAVKLIMENASNARLQTNIPVNQTINRPGTQQR